MRNILLLFLIITCLLNCSKEKDKLLLEILNDEIFVYNLNSDDNHVKYDSVFENYKKKGVSIIKFKITNPGQKPILFFPVCNSFFDFGCCGRLSYPNKFENISLNNLIVLNENDSIIKPHYSLINREYTDIDLCFDINDSINNEYYNKIGYKEKSQDWKMMNSEFINKSIVIHPNETLFFESYMRIPLDEHGFVYSGYLSLDKAKSYKAKLSFKTNIENINDWLTDTQKLNVQENDYDFFYGELNSLNSVPLIFKKL